MPGKADAAFIVNPPGEGPGAGELFRKNGIGTEEIEPDWSQGLESVVDQVEEEVENRLENYSDPSIYFYGNGLGGVAALSASTSFRTRAQILVDMPREFREEVDGLSLLGRIFRALKHLNPFAPDIDFRPSLSAIGGSGTGKIFLFEKGGSEKRTELLDAETRPLENGPEARMDDLEQVIRKL